MDTLDIPIGFIKSQVIELALFYDIVKIEWSIFKFRACNMTLTRGVVVATLLSQLRSKTIGEKACCTEIKKKQVFFTF